MSPEQKRLDAYCTRHTSQISELLYRLERETHLKTLAPQMSSGPLQGALLRLLCQLKRPQTVLEIGTFTAYATLCMADGLPAQSLLHTIEANEELEYLIRKYLEEAAPACDVRLHIGQAQDIIPQLEDRFDMVFIDAGKKDYAFYYDLVFDRVNPGGLILADNVLWDGKVAKGAKDEDTRIINAFNEKVQQDERVENLMLPIRDGLLIAQKLG
ncbi:MAG: O-methyltransferase [Bacteroidota bacterium]